MTSPSNNHHEPPTAAEEENGRNGGSGGGGGGEPTNRILVSNISEMVDGETLAELFGECGTITNTPLQIQRIGMVRVCEIQFQTPQQAQAAALLDGTPLDTVLSIKLLRKAPSPQLTPAQVEAQKRLQAIAQPQPNTSPAGSPSPPPASSPSSVSVPHPSPLPPAPSFPGPRAAEALRNIAQPGYRPPPTVAKDNVWSAPPKPAPPAVTPSPGAGVPEMDDSVRRTIYIGNLPLTVTAAELREFFTQSTVNPPDSLEYVKVSERPSSKSSSSDPERPVLFAFIEFSTAEQADTAVSEFNGRKFPNEVMGQALRVGLAKKPISKDPPAAENDKLREAMETVRRAQERLKRKLERQERQDRKRDSETTTERDRRRSRRRASRSRHRRSRSRSPGEARDRRRRRDRSRERSRSRSRERERRRSRSRSSRRDRRRRDRSRSSRGDERKRRRGERKRERDSSPSPPSRKKRHSDTAGDEEEKRKQHSSSSSSEQQNDIGKTLAEKIEAEKKNLEAKLKQDIKTEEKETTDPPAETVNGKESDGEGGEEEGSPIEKRKRGRGHKYRTLGGRR